MVSIGVGARASKGVGEVASEREDPGDQMNKRIRKCGKASGEIKENWISLVVMSCFDGLVETVLTSLGCGNGEKEKTQYLSA